MMHRLVLLTLIGRAAAMHNFADTDCGKGDRARPALKVLGGADAEPNQFPWLVSVTRRGGHFCGGTLLTRTHVLTAGHCMCSGFNTIVRPQTVRVTVGEHDLRNRSASEYEMPVSEITVHPSYTCDRVAHDIAIMELARPVSWSRDVSPACLPAAAGDRDYATFDNERATVAGWGWVTEDKAIGSRANVLQKAAVNVIETDTCRRWYKSQGKKTTIKDTQMCAGYENGGIDACWADSGGPLMVKAGHQLVVVGVVSTGIGCGRRQLPGLYTRVSEYIPWIRSVLKSA